VDLRQLRAGILARTERQIVQLTIAIAERIVQREIAVDRMLLVGMARAALDRVGLRATATIRLHPEDYQAISAGAPFAGDAAIRIVADPAVEACGCIVESELGTIDAAPDAQFRELVRALFDDAGVEEASGVANHAVA
jgi:flagellar assembly protein FliH